MLAGPVRLSFRQVSEVTDDGLVSVTVGLIHGEQEAAHLTEANLKLLVGHSKTGI